ncbi:MAG: hypothetical protein CMP11_05555 [Zetaproteobacteria bacterium]|nr:hypothetical protein [Pseudobdellovibrionaceae bacterium]|tara:strand:- start:581 stop:784 length:204 start_codon:yes stop_codon:yes gene_type:complete
MKRKENKKKQLALSKFSPQIKESQDKIQYRKFAANLKQEVSEHCSSIDYNLHWILEKKVESQSETQL